jgi:hypothetical protein
MSSSPQATSPRAVPSSASRAPLAQVESRFGGKEKLVSAVKSLASSSLWLDRLNADKGLERVSNAKLLRLHAVLTRVQSEFGTRDKLVAALLDLQNRSQDEGLRARLETYPLPRLLDSLDVLKRRARRAAKAEPVANAEGRKRPARSKRAQAKARQA